MCACVHECVCGVYLCVYLYNYVVCMCAHVCSLLYGVYLCMLCVLMYVVCTCTHVCVHALVCVLVCALMYLQYIFRFFSGFEDNLTCSDIHGMSQGLTEEEKQKRIQSYGPNSIDVPVKPYHALFIEEVCFYEFTRFLDDNCIMCVVYIELTCMMPRVV